MDRVADNASRAGLGWEHSGMVIAAVVEWLKKEDALRLAVRSASVGNDEAITTALLAMSVAGLFEFRMLLSVLGKTPPPGASSFEPRFCLDGSPVTILGKGRQQQLYLLQHLERMVIPQTFEALFPGGSHGIQRVSEVSVFTSMSSGNSSGISVPTTVHL